MQDLSSDSMDVRVTACYKGRQGMERIGATAPITVSWKPAQLKFHDLKDANNADKPVGGIHIAHRWVEEADLKHSMIAPRSPRTAPRQATGPVDLASASGKFANNDPARVIEAAAVAVEAQNRALVQRVNLARQYKSEVLPD